MNTRKKILVVDDNAANLTTCKAILKDSYDVFTALSAESMLTLLEDITPDLIMLDIRMPGLDGYETAKLLKKDEVFNHIPIIFVTALNDVESEMEGLELGAVDYISKPYFPPVLLRRIQTHLDLVEKTRQLELVSQAKTNFLANMSHEMRTPLTAVLGLTELILNTVHFDDETYGNLAKIYRAGETLLDLINDILDMSKIEADSFALNLTRYDVPAMLGDAITQSMLYIDSKPIEFSVNIDENVPSSLFGDALRVKQILNNLLSNAFKYTQAGSVELGVRCETEPDDETVWFIAWVADTGIGIREENMSKLFSTYSRMEDDLHSYKANHNVEGTGLGLYISKKIAEMMGGTIEVESKYGKGSRFTVRLRQENVGGGVIGQKTAESLGKLHFYADEFQNKDKTRINMSYAKVLVVDDNLANLEVAKSLLGLFGIKADCVSSARQAIEAVRSEQVKYDAIFMDHIMPEMDGIEAARVIREEVDSWYAKNVPLIALTANALVGNEEMFKQKGFQAFLPKPIELSRLDTILRTWVRCEKAEAQLAEKTITTQRRTVRSRVLHEGIGGLDVPKGIAYFGDNEEIYIKTLQGFAKGTKQALADIADVSEQSLADYATAVHGIKGSAYGIFAQSLGDDAFTLEKAAKAGDIDFVREHNETFMQNIAHLIDDIEKVCRSGAVISKPERHTPDGELLARFLEACKSFDIDEMDAAMEEIDKYTYTADNGLAAWLRDSLDKGNYNEIINRLQ